MSFLTACERAKTANRLTLWSIFVASDLDKLLKFLEVEQMDKYLFRGNSPKRPSRVFGGQVLAQALNAALMTV